MLTDGALCGVCDHPLGPVLMEHDRPDRFETACGVSAQGYRRQWRGCPACGSATNTHMPDNLARLRTMAASYYEVDFANSSPGEKFAWVMGLPPEKSDNAGRVERVLDFLRRRPGGLGAIKALDIGAGLGVFLAQLLRRSAALGAEVEALAVEPDPHAAAHLRGLGLFQVHEGLFQGQGSFAGRTLVTLNKVLEHIESPLPVLADVARVLDPERGVLYVEVPDVLTIGRRPPTDNILGALHHHLYSIEGLAGLIGRAGLVPLAIERLAEPSGKISVHAFAVPPAALT